MRENLKPFIVYVNLALSVINKNSDKILNNNKIYYRNRLIDCATRMAQEHPSGMKHLYDEIYPIYVSDVLSAEHHGKPIGTIIGYKGWNKDKSIYTRRLAKLKRGIKIIVKEMVK